MEEHTNLAFKRRFKYLKILSHSTTSFDGKRTVPDPRNIQDPTDYKDSFEDRKRHLTERCEGRVNELPLISCLGFESVFEYVGNLQPLRAGSSHSRPSVKKINQL